MSLRVNVAQLMKEPVGSTRPHSFDQRFEPLDDEQSAIHARGNARLTKSIDGIWVSGKVDATMESVCSRCLVPFGHVVHVEFEETFLPTVDIAVGRRLRADGETEDDEFTIDEHHILGLAEAIRQNALAAVPTDCLGLCQVCGADLNEGPCHEIQKIDPVWAPLQQLLKGNQG
ncbi:MAG: DUF177 domain-containing protein [Chloroflexi bacterium]|nr:DUF177 domain-containing protein [Chloroflexota bacterium]